VTKECPLNIFPLYVRAGSIVPMGPALHYVTEQPAAPYEIRIYPGADAQFTIYEDDGETYDYEKGHRATYQLTWDDAAKTLRISGRDGSFPGLVPTRKLEITFPTKAVLTGSNKAPVARSVDYSGQPLQLQF